MGRSQEEEETDKKAKGEAAAEEKAKAARTTAAGTEAEGYLEVFEGKEYSRELIQTAAQQGTRLLAAAGGWENAAVELRRAGQVRQPPRRPGR